MWAWVCWVDECGSSLCTETLHASDHPRSPHRRTARQFAGCRVPRKKGALKCKGCATQAPTCEHLRLPPPLCVFCPLFFSLAHVDPCWRGTSQTGMPQHKPASQSSLLGRSSARGASAAGGVGRSAGARATRTRAHTPTPHRTRTHRAHALAARAHLRHAACSGSCGWAPRRAWVGVRVVQMCPRRFASPSLTAPSAPSAMAASAFVFALDTSRHDTTHTHWAFDPRTACLCVCARASSLSPTLSPTSVSRLVPVRRDLDSPLSLPLFEARWPSRSSMTLPSTGS